MIMQTRIRFLLFLATHTQLCRLGKLQNREGVRSFSASSPAVEVRRFPSSFSFTVLAFSERVSRFAVAIF